MIVVKIKHISENEEVQVTHKIKEFLNKEGLYPNVVVSVTDEYCDSFSKNDKDALDI